MSVNEVLGCVICIDWRSAEETGSSKRKASIQSDFLQYYNKLKASIATTDSTDLNDPPTMQLSNDKRALFKQLIDIDKATQDYKRSGWQHYERFGVALAMLKRMYFTVCFQCKPRNPTVFYILSCQGCALASKGNNFFKDLGQKIKYSNGYINNLIRIAGLSSKYPIVKLTPWNFRHLSKYMTYLPEQMEKDRHIWLATSPI